MSTRRLSAIAAGTTLSLAAAASGSPAMGVDAAPAPDPWVSVTPDGYHRFAIPHADVREIVGAEPVAVELQGNIGPAGTWSDLATELQGGQYVTSVGHLAPGVYYYQYTATLVDRTKVSFKEPTSPVAVTSQTSWNTFFVPGEPVAWMQDAAEPGAVTELEVPAAAGGTAHVWTPPGYDPDRTEPYPALLLLAGAEQSAREWVELGRAPQILDNLAAEGAIKPMVVVMAQVEDARAVTEHLVPAVRRDFHVADGAGALAVAGIADGARHALAALRDSPGAFGAVGAFSALLADEGAESLAEGLTRPDGGSVAPEALLRLYVGNVLDPAYDDTLALLTALGATGTAHEFDGVDPGSGATWDTWREALRDFAPRAFGDRASSSLREGHLPLDEPYVPPSDIATPHVDANGIVTFVTGTQWADAKDVTVWGNWAPNGAWFRIPMARDGDSWRLSLGPLDGFYYYRYVVDGVDHKDPADSVNTLTGVSPLFVPGETDLELADAPTGQGGNLEVLTYSSQVAPGERSAYVWTPPGYDPDRAEPYPLLVLNHGGDQSWGDWVEVGRARQILDNLAISGKTVPMVVAMGDGNVSDFPAEVLENLIPALEADFHVASEGSRRAIAGLSMGAMNSLTTWLTRPGEFAYVGAFSGFFFQTPDFDVEAVNAGTTLARIYTGDSSDFTHDGTMGLMAMLDERGVAYEFPGETPGPHGFDTWQANLVDFAPSLFRDEAPADDDDAASEAPEAGGETGEVAGRSPSWLALAGAALVVIALGALAAWFRRRSPRDRGSEA